jgi:hypothetical protein
MGEPRLLRPGVLGDGADAEVDLHSRQKERKAGELYGCDLHGVASLAQRKPTSSNRASGGRVRRRADRKSIGDSGQEPPRRTLYWPVDGPVGFRAGEVR